eukprot:scaffold3286_cov129-Isochrysis_galbana.AAC.5
MNSPSSRHCFGEAFSGASRSTSSTHSRTDSSVRPGERATGGEVDMIEPKNPVSSRSSEWECRGQTQGIRQPAMLKHTPGCVKRAISASRYCELTTQGGFSCSLALVDQPCRQLDGEGIDGWTELLDEQSLDGAATAQQSQNGHPIDIRLSRPRGPRNAVPLAFTSSLIYIAECGQPKPPGFSDRAGRKHPRRRRCLGHPQRATQSGASRNGTSMNFKDVTKHHTHHTQIRNATVRR